MYAMHIHKFRHSYINKTKNNFKEKEGEGGRGRKDSEKGKRKRERKRGIRGKNKNTEGSCSTSTVLNSICSPRTHSLVGILTISFKTSIFSLFIPVPQFKLFVPLISKNGTTNPTQPNHKTRRNPLEKELLGLSSYCHPDSPMMNSPCRSQTFGLW